MFTKTDNQIKTPSISAPSPRPATATLSGTDQIMHRTTGYMHPLYADSFSEWAQPRPLSQSGGWILTRPIQDTGLLDAMGCYPLFACRDWQALEHDLRQNPDGLVSLSMVTDPFADVDESTLRRSFDLVKPFKCHFVVDLTQPLEQIVCADHRRNIRLCLDRMEVELIEQPLQYLDTWWDLYNQLIKRHAITGIRAFSRASFKKQLQVPGIVMFVGRDAETGKIIGADTIIISGNCAYGHLSAFTDAGYRAKASFGLYWHGLKYLAERGIRWVDFGGGAGADPCADDGLTRFKRGWANAQRLCWLCGKIFLRDAYDSLSRDRGLHNETYFPAYRAGEFLKESK